MGLKEYEVDSPGGKITVQLSDEDAEQRGLSGGSDTSTAEEFVHATGAPGVPEPQAAPDTPDVPELREAEGEDKPKATKREQAASKAFGAKNK